MTMELAPRTTGAPLNGPPSGNARLMLPKVPRWGLAAASAQRGR